MSGTASDALKLARNELGRTDGTKYGKLMAKLTGQSWYSAQGVPYCAMFVSWVLDKAGVSCPGLPGAYCPSVHAAAKRAGKVISDKKKARPGDVVLYDWECNGDADHVGIVERAYSGYVQAIEGNTSGGRVARRTRAWSTVLAVVRPDYSATSAATEAAGALDVDGLWGSATTLRAQEVLGLTYKDGVVSRQNPAHRSRMPGCTTGWEWGLGDGSGSPLVAALQRVWGAEADGIMGPDTINKMIAYYMRHGSGATVCDGRLDSPSPTIKAFQRRLRQGTI